MPRGRGVAGARRGHADLGLRPGELQPSAAQRASAPALRTQPFDLDQIAALDEPAYVAVDTPGGVRRADEQAQLDVVRDGVAGGHATVGCYSARGTFRNHQLHINMRRSQSGR